MPERRRRQRIDQSRGMQFSELVAREAAVKADLTEVGGIERYVDSGRVPFFTEAQVGGRQVVFLYIPPEGTQVGDRCERIIGGYYRFSSPDGKIERGMADMISITPQESRALELRRDAQLDSKKQNPG